MALCATIFTRCANHSCHLLIIFCLLPSFHYLIYQPLRLHALHAPQRSNSVYISWSGMQQAMHCVQHMQALVLLQSYLHSY